MAEGQLANITLAAAIRCGSPQEDLKWSTQRLGVKTLKNMGFP